MLFHKKKNSLILILLVALFTSCKKDNTSTSIKDTLNNKKLFTYLTPKQTGIHFINELKETLDYNYYQYNYTYIGGGVAAGDLNDDGYIDLYFISNSGEDKIYMNLGSLNFKDVSKTSGITNIGGFSTGVTMADVNNDGLLDIYICKGGLKDNTKELANKLYINEGNFHFSEQAEAYGLADANRSIQATFFDYDKDNDLDVYISNTPVVTGKEEVVDLNKVLNNPKTMDLKGCDRLYQNDGKGHFKDVSQKAGLSYDIGFGLNPIVGDLNIDGWPDVYVCNDFNFPDLVYLNNKNGTFTESKDKLFKHMSFNSMGSDLVDINNDGALDLMTLDMNPQDYIRSKTTMAMTSIDVFESMVDNGYHNQYMHNMLQLNNSNGTFSEISKMAGIADTDWSWSILSADFDLDGFNDIYITNGVYRDVMDRDKVNETLQILRANGRKPTKEDFLKFAKMLPQQKLNNYFYKNNGDLTFEDTSDKWIDTVPTFSNGAVYADLDNDGDLEIVVNNINDEASILKNNTLENNRSYFLKIDLQNDDANIFGVGAVVNLYFEDGTMQSKQVINTRGFLSAVPYTLHFGLGKHLKIDTLEIIWPDDKIQILKDVDANQSLLMNHHFAENKKIKTDTKRQLLTPLKSNFKHTDPYFNDYELQVLLPHKLSQLGPALAKGDINNDGIDDVFIGGANGVSGALIIGDKSGKFTSKPTNAFILDKKYEDVGAAFFDADNDGDQDLYVVHGSYEYYGYPSAMQDVLYLNDGNGVFSKSEDALPEIVSAGSVVIPSDYDNDGDIDLFIGGRVIPGEYPHAPISYLLKNEKGKFKNSTSQLAPELEKIGMVTDATWIDINDDNQLDLVVTGEWMGIEVFTNSDGKLLKSNNFKALNEASGWWNKLLIADIDNDGDNDIVAGNLGLNYKFHASKKKPFQVYATDFDFNGTQDVILSKKYNGKDVPIRGKSCMTQQLPHLAQKIKTYNEFASLDLQDIVGKRIEKALNYKITEFRSGIFVNNGNNDFSFSPFESKLQASLINSMLFEDINNDGFKDLILAGNNYQSEVETTRADAGIGSILLGNGKGDFKYTSHLETGFFVDKDVRHMVLLSVGSDNVVFVANNNDYHSLFKINKTN